VDSGDKAKGDDIVVVEVMTNFAIVRGGPTIDVNSNGFSNRITYIDHCANGRHYAMRGHTAWILTGQRQTSPSMRLSQEPCAAHRGHRSATRSRAYEKVKVPPRLGLGWVGAAGSLGLLCRA
jgi:hypothetical protein